jgi:hypothetical protein
MARRSQNEMSRCAVQTYLLRLAEPKALSGLVKLRLTW